MSFDPLSEVLRTVRLTGAVFFDVEAAAPWAVSAPKGCDIAARVLPGAQHLISYHVITSGSCWAGLQDEPPVRLEAGDVIVFPQGDAHRMASAPELRAAAPDLEVYTPPPGTLLPLPVREGGEGRERTHFVCGFLGCDVRPFNPLIATLPRLMHVSDRGDSAGRLRQFIEVAVAESRERRAGGESVLARLSELMFIEVVRRQIEALPPEQTGWLAGLRDEHVGRALAAMHQSPTRPWSLEELAREAGLSRSTLAERFTFLVGQPPMQYLARWRMQVAAGLLARGAKVGAVALDVGYDSEAAFSRAFKKLVGSPPATWRDQQYSKSA